MLLCFCVLLYQGIVFAAVPLCALLCQGIVYAAVLLCIAVPGYSVCCCAFVRIAVPAGIVYIAVPFFCMNQQTEDDACICCGAAVSTGCPHQLSQVCLKLGYDKVCTCVWDCWLNILCACIL